jgi:hypothetical protein
MASILAKISLSLLVGLIICKYLTTYLYLVCPLCNVHRKFLEALSSNLMSVYAFAQSLPTITADNHRQRNNVTVKTITWEKG